MIEVGRLCMKTAGRDAGKKCVIVEVLEGNFVLIDGQTRRRKCNILHLEPLKDSIKIKKGISHSDIASEFKKLGLEIKETKQKEKKERPLKQRKGKKTQIADKIVAENKNTNKKDIKRKEKQKEKKTKNIK
ncbi:MAG: 50S ribosomal protein L14e [Candidatus Woesearchaeota archaeon]